MKTNFVICRGHNMETRNAVDIMLSRIGLLSFNEYEKLKKNIKPVGFYWWLSSSYESGCASYVDFSGEAIKEGFYTDAGTIAVRPALIVSDSNSRAQLAVGDTLLRDWVTWTYIGDGYLLHDSCLAKMPFSCNQAFDDYGHSDIKKYLDNWYEDNVING